RESMSRGRTKA
ncbi:hypothetical protein I314_00364, partial [Cryptococcus bacillisporus CA1873]